MPLWRLSSKLLFNLKDVLQITLRSAAARRGSFLPSSGKRSDKCRRNARVVQPPVAWTAHSPSPPPLFLQMRQRTRSLVPRDSTTELSESRVCPLGQVLFSGSTLQDLTTRT
jgi:hypothetical protein